MMVLSASRRTRRTVTQSESRRVRRSRPATAAAVTVAADHDGPPADHRDSVTVTYQPTVTYSVDSLAGSKSVPVAAPWRDVSVFYSSGPGLGTLSRVTVI